MYVFKKTALPSNHTIRCKMQEFSDEWSRHRIFKNYSDP